MDQDLTAARKLQCVLQPTRLRSFPGLEVALGLRPARGITGDMYDFFDRGDEYAVIVFGDVSGKGAAAALYGALISGLLRRSRRGSGSRRCDAIAERNSAGAQGGRAVRDAAGGAVGAADRRRRCANAGAEPPFIYRRGEILKPKAEGVPIGLLEAREYEEVAFQTEIGRYWFCSFRWGGGSVERQGRGLSERPRVQKLLKKRGGQSPK